MLNYFHDIEKIWGDEGVNMFIVKVGVSLFPVLEECGMGLKAPVALVVDDEDTAEAVFREIAGFNFPQMIPLGMPHKEFEAYMVNAGYELLTVICRDTNKQNLVNLEALQMAMTIKRAGDNKFNFIPLIAFCGGIPQELTGCLAGRIVIEGKRSMNTVANSEEVVRKMVTLLKDSWPIIDHRLQNLKQDRKVNLDFLNCATEALKVIVEREADGENRDKIIQQIDRTARKMKESWEIIKDYSAWVDLLRDAFFKEAQFIPRIVERKNASYGEAETLKVFPIYDSKFYYITSDFFDKVCRRLPYIGNLEMKKALSDGGILVGEGGRRSYFTVKVPVTTAAGRIKPSRRLRIVRSWLDLPGELTWKERIEAQRRERPNE